MCVEITINNLLIEMAPPKRGATVLKKEKQPLRSPIDSSSTVLVVGASRNIGLQLVRQCLALGARVIGTERTSSALHRLSGNKHILKADVTDGESIEQLAESLENESPITHFIYNAGMVQVGGSLHTATVQQMQSVYSVNTVGFVRTIQAVMKNLAAEAVIAVVGSRMGSISQNWYGEAYAYRASKAALNIICKGISVEYEDQFAVVMLHPGRIGSVPLTEGVQGMLNAVQATDIDSEFRFVNYNAELIPW